ncbi:glycosyltransferase family 4 protein [Mangrovimonas sp. TPBH4]|uniref:glycosyltransferase family 4 protein n=1 Tax=Mangrovimonas sp. TPBH4 TaxID=1645914 RepID=UPI0006B5A67F|nr:glycosyltransferase family 4 protein [Mangrovimonas sp. TPBH4]
MNKKTIGFTIGSLNAGGAERVLTSLANELIKNYNVTIITLVRCDSFYELHPQIKIRNCNLGRSGAHSTFDAIKKNIRKLQKITEIVNQEGIELLIGFTTSINVLTVISSHLSKIPSIISERNNALLDPPNKFWKTLRNITYKYANFLVVQTLANKSFYAKIVPNEKIFVIKNPIAPSLASKRLKSIDKKKSILTVGRLDSNKSQDLLIKAFSNISENYNWYLQIVGDGKKKEDYKQLVKNLNIENQVSFLGNVTNLYDYYNDASIFVLTSKSEGFPNTLAEALYFGIPCISTNCPHGPSDLITNGINGLLIEVDNQQMLENELEKLINNKKLRNNISKNAIKKSQQLNIDLIIGLWEKLIKEVL